VAADSDFTLMTKAECQRFVDEYVHWLKQELKATALDGSCQITTPFLDRHNDAIEIYVEKKDGPLRLTDDGYTIQDLRASGMEFTTERRKAHLAAVLNGFGVKLENDEICVVGSLEDFPQKKHNLVQAILAVNDMFVMAEEHVLSLFKEDVALFLEAHRVPAFSDFKLSGKSGFDHKFDFGLPKTAEKPQRVLQAINNLAKENTTSIAFALADVRAIRTDPLGALAMINDTVRPPNEDYLAALRVYEVEPLLWSQRQQAISFLNGRY
jgi:hypothetical protein